MSIQLGSILDKQAQGLYLHARKAEFLAANIANAETPGYKARDIDFRSALRAVSEERMTKTDPRHFSVDGGGASGDVYYRKPAQASINGNTVDMPVEQAAYAENAVRYQINLSFVDGTVKGLMLAIRGD